jgi:hypothetical protein
LCDLPAQGRTVDEVDERTLPADLDDRQPFPIPGLEIRIAVDLDLLEAASAELRDECGARPLAEVAVAPAEEDDARDKYRASSSLRPPA